MASVSSKIFEIFRNLKSDAVPRPPRSDPQTDAEPEQPRNPRTESEPQTNEIPQNKESGDESEHEEIIFNEDDFVKDDFLKGEKKPKFKFPFYSKKCKDDPKDPKKNGGNGKSGSYSSVNTQATGPVFNIVNAKGVQVGSNHVYYMSATNGNDKTEKKTETGNHIEKDNLIILLMESTIEPTHKYIHFVANNLGLDWKSFYVTLGYLEGRVETCALEKGITEARYKLLREWVDNADNATLGRMATLLWEEGERQIVRELSLIYKENKK